jgi:hypothetical protein
MIVLLVVLAVMIGIMVVGIASGVYWMLLPAACGTASIIYFMVDLRRRNRRRR